MNLDRKHESIQLDLENIARKNGLKRAADVAAVSVIAPIVLPLMLVIAVAIRFFDGRPVLFRQERLGFHEKTFSILKFRTMRVAEQSESDHQRMTKLGYLLRKSSLDELPQLLNVLRGDMSLVGPRPLYPHYLPHYSASERTRHLVRPGITGLAQVSGRNGLRWASRLSLDSKYVSRMSMIQDLAILIRTVKQVRSGEGVSVVARETGEPLDVERSYPRSDGYAIRRFNALDIDTRVQWMSSPATSKYMSLPADVTVASTRDWYVRTGNDSSRDDFVVYKEATDKVVSMLGLKGEPGNKSGLLYIFTDPELHGQGIGKRSLQLLIDWAGRSRYGQITLSVDAQNTAAIRLYESLGFESGPAVDHRVHYRKDV